MKHAFLQIIIFILLIGFISNDPVTGKTKILYTPECKNIVDINCNGLVSCLNQTCQLWNLTNNLNLSFILLFDNSTCNHQNRLQFESQIKNEIPETIIDGIKITTCDYYYGPYICTSYQCVLDSICKIQKLNFYPVINFATFPIICDF